jgi:5-enolpyruvylshikimate-3-phosphate synthase
LRGHESDRIKEMTVVLDLAQKGMDISSKDHRVVQAISMWSAVNAKSPKILFPESVSKSWPQFWDFMKYAATL